MDDLLWQLHGLTSCAAEARTAFSGQRQQLRTDLTLRPFERCVEGLSLCGPSDAEHRVNQDQVEARHAPKSDPVFLHVKAGMTVIVSGTEGAWRMADVIWVDGGARNPKVPTLFQVADVDTGVINWINADLVTHICPRV